MGGPIRTYFRNDRGYGRLRPFIILSVLRVSKASAVLGRFSEVLRAFGRSLGLLLPPLGGLPGALGGSRGAWGGFLGAPLRLFNAALTS